MKKILLQTIALLMLVFTSFAHAEGGIAGEAKSAISGSSADLTTVGGAIIVVVAGIWVIKRIIALIR